MAASLSVSGGSDLYSPITVSVSGAAATTAYSLLVLVPSGHTQTLALTTDGSGAASVKFTRLVSGKYNYTLQTANPTVVATASSHG